MMFKINSQKFRVCTMVSVQLIVHPRWSIASLPQAIFSTALQIWLGLPHWLVASILHCMYTTHLRIHLLRYAHISEHMGTQDVVQDVIGSIGWEVNFQVVHDTTSHVSFIHATNILSTESYPKTSSYFSWQHHHGSHTHQPFISNDFNTRVCNL
jgi:hypothetical protein